ncbi:MAG: hypothetical protein IT423_15835 [Pirellulaceae bacterium]|nr:hypothetical protein [Pirellulaceae bacterium]
MKKFVCLLLAMSALVVAGCSAETSSAPKTVEGDVVTPKGENENRPENLAPKAPPL